MGTLGKRELAALIEEAVIDANGEWEQTGGFCVMIEENLSLPFRTVIFGVEVTVVGVEQTSDTTIAAVCRRGKEKQRIGLLDLPLPSPAPEGAEWVEAFRHWSRWTA